MLSRLVSPPRRFETGNSCQRYLLKANSITWYPTKKSKHEPDVVRCILKASEGKVSFRTCKMPSEKVRKLMLRRNAHISFGILKNVVG